MHLNDVYRYMLILILLLITINIISITINIKDWRINTVKNWRLWNSETMISKSRSMKSNSTSKKWKGKIHCWSRSRKNLQRTSRCLSSHRRNSTRAIRFLLRLLWPWWRGPLKTWSMNWPAKIKRLRSHLIVFVHFEYCLNNVGFAIFCY